GAGAFAGGFTFAFTVTFAVMVTFAVTFTFACAAGGCGYPICGVAAAPRRKGNASPGTRTEECSMKRMSNLNDLFAHELRDLYSAEHMILDALPKTAAATENAELKRAFQQHEQTTHEQVRRLETIGDELSIQLKGHKCRGMEGILEECQER